MRIGAFVTVGVVLLLVGYTVGYWHGSSDVQFYLDGANAHVNSLGEQLEQERRKNRTVKPAPILN